MTDLTPERLQELRRIAEAATPGPWEWREREHNERIRKRGQPWSRRQFIYCLQGPPLSDVAPEHRDEFDYHTVMSLRWDDRIEATPLTGVVPTPADAEFIATFDPPTVVALLDEIERLRREREVLVEALMPASEALADLDQSYYRVARKDPTGYVMGSVSVASLVTVIESTRKALALLDGEKGGDRGWPTRESVRARLVAEVGECCRGADPLCAAGCLVEAALRQRLVDKVGGES